MHMLNNGRSYKKIKTLKHLKHIVKLSVINQKNILNITLQVSDNKILLIKIVLNEGKHKMVQSTCERFTLQL